MMDRTDWPDSRIDQLEATVRAFGPTAAQLARVEANQEALEVRVGSNHAALDRRIDELKGDIHEGRRSVRNTLLALLGPVAATGIVALATVALRGVA